MSQAEPTVHKPGLHARYGRRLYCSETVGRVAYRAQHLNRLGLHCGCFQARRAKPMKLDQILLLELLLELVLELDEIEELLPLMVKLDFSELISLGEPFRQHLWHLQ